MPNNANHFLDNYHNDTSNLTKHIASQLPKEIGSYDRFKENTLDFYTLLDSLHSHMDLKKEGVYPIIIN